MTRCAGQATILVAVAFSARASDFADAFRTPSASYFITPIGEVHAIRPGRPLEKAFIFRDARNLPYRWSRPPTSLVQWKSQWLVADGSNRLVRFHEGGTYDALIELPIRVPKLAVAGDAIWAVNLVAANAAEQLWRSTDGHTFSPHTGGVSRAQFDSPANNLLILSGSGAGDVYVASVIGPPLVHRIWPPERRADIRIAYSRSKKRAGMEVIVGAVEDVTAYSLPLRDMLPLPAGGLSVLRNREDIRGSTPALDLLKGRRVDQYDRGGRQIATAVFARSVHWLTHVTDKTVTGVSNTGDVVMATWGEAVPGEILSP